jgi:signal transduction histidine kinase
LGRNPNELAFFYVDSENEHSPDYSPPGQVYGEASTQLLSAFTEESPFVEGPIRDSYGNWVSALAPVVDESSGKVVAILGVDMPAKSYYMRIATYSMIPILLSALPLLVLVRNRRLEAKEREITDLKTQFVSVASHELRSPLSGTLWGVQSLIKPGKGKKLTKEQEQILTDVYNNTASSLATVNEILDFSIFDRGKADKLQREEVNLVDVLKDVQKPLSLTILEAGVEISFVDKWPKNVVTIGDPGALKRAFSNILSNAIKYSPRGRRIEIALHTDGKEHVIGIRDHGIGIPKSEQKNVLEGYYRAANATKVKAHGTGMGLWVTKLIIEQHHGKLWLTSKENSGTTVFVALPAKRQRQQRSD